MKKYIIIALLLLGSIGAQAQIDKIPAHIEKTPDELSQRKIKNWVTAVNPDIKNSTYMDNLASFALNQWIDVITPGGDPQGLRLSFMFTNKDYAVVCNLWAVSKGKGLHVLEMLFTGENTLIARNFGNKNLIQRIEASKDVGVAFIHVTVVDNSKEDIDIYLILLQ